MFILVSSEQFDINGKAILRIGLRTDLETMSRRANRTGTLDGGVVMEDYGFSHGDRTLDVRIDRVTARLRDTLKGMIQLHAYWLVSLPDGVYRCAPDSLATDSDEGLRLTLLVEKKVSP